MKKNEQEQAIVKLKGIKDQVEKEHWLNVHFRAFELADMAWKEHIRANAITGSDVCNSPGGAVLHPKRDGDHR